MNRTAAILMEALMWNSIKKIATRAILFLRDNPHILYTAFLLIVIPFAFLVSGERFLDTAKANQERIEKERIGLMQDVFAGMLREGGYFDNEFSEEIRGEDSFLQNVILKLKEENPSLQDLKVVLRSRGGNVVIASLVEGEVGSVDTLNDRSYKAAGLDASSSIIFEEHVSGIRHWKAVRALTDTMGEIRGFLFMDASMEYIDAAAARNIRNAYYILFGIVFVIMLLLARQAKVVDYAVLYRKLKEVDQMKDDFVSMAAHELRTPLSVIKGYMSMISTEHLSAPDKEGISRVNISVENLNNLVGDILDAVKIDQGRIRFEMKEVDVTGIVSEIVESLQYLAQEKHLTLTFVRSEISKISADPVRLKQALINIIGNAIKYTPQGSVSVVVTEENGRVSIRVRDTGIGISAEDQKKLFGKFLRIRSKETEDIRGTGLGLWITAQIISGMNGKISVESIKGKGSDFIFSFPVASQGGVR